MRFLIYFVLLLTLTEGGNVVNNCTNAVVDCSNHGTCLPDLSCECDERFATHECNGDVQCCYRRKSTMGAVTIQMTGLVFNLGLYYLGYYQYFGILLMSMVSSLIFFKLALCRGERVPFSQQNPGLMELSMFFFFYPILIGICVLFMIAFERLDDGNGVPLTPWQ